MRETMKISGLLCALLFAVGGAEAAGLGKLSVQSALGQPLRAEIELLSVNKDELSAVTARLAGADAFRQARIERIEALATLRFSVDQRANGQPIIRVSSSVPISDPFLDMLVEVNWTSGRILREYTILLDPPAEARTAPAQAIVAPEAARPVQPASAPERKPVAEAAKPKAVEPTPAPAKQPSRYGPVKSGETLRGIAGKVRHENVTLEQMMVGLYQANRKAFYADNMNRMKRGQVLNVPEAEAVQQQASPTQAARTVQGQTAEWHAYRRKVAEMAPEAPAAKAPEPAVGKIAPKVEETAPASAAAPKDVLKLSKGEPGGAGRPDGKTQEKLHALEEELASKGRALQEAQDRVGQLERTVRDMQKLLELKAQEAAKAPPAAAPAAAPAPAPAPAAPVAEVEPAPAPAAPPPPVAKPKPVPAPVALPEPPQPSGSSWLATFISSPLYIGGIVAAVLLSVLLWMMMVGSRRRQGLTKFEDSIMTGGEFKNNAVFNATTPASPASAGANTEGSMLLTDFSRLGLGAIDTHEVDPIAEAEVYMAYGRDAQAEEILKEALNKDPSRYEIALKLLEIYAARKDTMAFETLASELYASLGGQGTPVWQRAAEMGRSIDPSNPLYRATSMDSALAQTFGAKPTGKPTAAAAQASGAAMAPTQADAHAELGRVSDWDASTAAPGVAGSGLEFAAAPPMLGDDFDIPPARQEMAPKQERVAPTLEEPMPEAYTASVPSGDDYSMEFEASGTQAAQPEMAPPSAEGFAEDLSWDVSLNEAANDSLTRDAGAEPAAVALEPEEIAVMAEPLPEPEAPAALAEDFVVSEPPAWKESELDMAFAPGFAPEPEAAEVPANVPVLDFSGIDLDLDSTPAQVEVEPAMEAMPTVAEFTPAEDFTPGVIEEFVPESATAFVAPEPLPQAAAAPAEVADPELWEEVNTKLDLARAYLEMGDKEGAREILQEVLGEGDARQKTDADKLLAEAG